MTNHQPMVYSDKTEQDRAVLYAEIERLYTAQQWQPIETAPRDGSRIVGWTLEGLDIVWWEELEPDGPEQSGHNPGWFGYCGTWPGRSPEHGFGGSGSYLEPPQNQPAHWKQCPPP